MAKMGEFATMPGSLFNELVNFYSTNPNLGAADRLNGLVLLATASNAAASSDKAVDLVELTMICIDLRFQKNAAEGAAAGSGAFTTANNALSANLQVLAGLYL